MTLPPLPTGLERDQTQHGRVYYTMRQMREYGQKCADAERSRIESDEYTSPIKQDDTVDFLRGMMGMK